MCKLFVGLHNFFYKNCTISELTNLYARCYYYIIDETSLLIMNNFVLNTYGARSESMNQTIGSGVITPLLTPINQDESINYEQMRALIDYVVDGGVDAIFIMGSTGEFARFDEATRGNIIRECVRHVAGRVLVYAGVADTGLAAVLRNVKSAQQAGADVLVVTLPYYYPIHNDDEAYSFFSSVAASTSLPVMLYNIPGTCGAAISMEVIARLSAIDNIVGVKDSSGDIDRIHEMVRRFKNGDKPFAITVGEESICFEGLCAGADGLVPSLSNPYPKLLADLYHASVVGDRARLRTLCDVMNDMNRLNRYSTAWMSPNVWRKKALSHMGICNAYCTRPYVPVDAETDRQVLQTIEQYKRLYG